MTIDAMRELSTAFHSLPGEVSADITKERDALKGYYTSQFGAEYARRNNNQQANIDQIFSRLGASAVPLQYRYILTNPNPLGEKDKLDKSPDVSTYSRLHTLYHPAFRELQQRFGYYDIFLIDADSGEVVYTVFKELDFSSSLKTGPFAESGLAEAYRGAMKLNEGQAYMTDFAPYVPSYQDPAAFIAAPIFYQGKRIGVIAFQMPIDKINSVMTSDGKWKESGFGESGETYLVGSDFKMRSLSRFWIEDPKGFLGALKAAGTEDPATISTMEAKQTVIGLQSVNSPGAKKAIDGNTGFDIFPDYRGIPVLSAYKPLDINGQRWAILAEVDEAEAYAEAIASRDQTIYMITIAAIVLLIISGALGWIYSAALARPLERIVASLEDISSGSGDLTVRLDASSKDELGQLAGAFNRFVEKIDTIMREISGSTNDLTTASENLSTVTNDTRLNMEQQQNEIHQVATAIEEMAATVREVARNTQATATAANHAEDQVSEGKNIVGHSVSAVQHLSDRIKQSHEVISALQQDSLSVGTVLDVIRGIAEQTNLLALNAAIEAARAGEHGRGFAVVADEVRNLAMKTQESTEEIRGIIESLQERSTETTKLLQENNVDIETTVDLSEKTQHAFQEIQDAMRHLLDMSTQIASASEEQSAVTEEIAQNIGRISQAAEDTVAGAEQTAASSEMLTSIGDGLFRLVGQFQVSADNKPKE
jgi:methyl-accepting chemotaxis protein